MNAIVGTIVGVVVVTTIAAWLIERRWPAGSYLSNSIWAAASVPVIAAILFAVMTAVTLVNGRGDHPANVGMPIFAGVFFLVYACMAGLIIGLPTAMIALKVMRSG
jgi:hypothetical protein